MIKEYTFYNISTCEYNNLESESLRGLTYAINLHLLEVWEIKEIFEDIIRNNSWSFSDIILARTNDSKIDFYYMDEPSRLTYLINSTHYYNIDFHYVDKIIRVEYEDRNSHVKYTEQDCIR